MPLTVAFADAYPHLQGGAQDLTRVLAQELAGRGLSTRLVVPGLGATAHHAADDGTQVVVVPASAALSRYGRSTVPITALAALPGWWTRARHAFADTDIVHCNGQRGMVLFAPAARMARVPVVYHRHSWPQDTRLEPWLLRMARVVLVPSPAMATDVATRTSRTTVVVRGWAPPRGRPSSPGSFPRIACVARLHPDKGLEALLATAARLRDRWPDLHLDVVGGADPKAPAHADELLARAHQLGLDGAVTWHGHLDEPWAVAGQATVYVQPSRVESQGLALYQAMAMGLPVVASDIPPFRAAVTSPRLGRLVPGDDPAAAAMAVDDLLSDANERSAIARAARAAAAAWSVEEMVDGVLAAYDGVGGPAGRRTR